jgi:hypothetical protein
MAGANDYRSVDIKVPDADVTKINGDAWLGVFKSLDGGQNWKSVLLPGYSQDPGCKVAAARPGDTGDHVDALARDLGVGDAAREAEHSGERGDESERTLDEAKFHGPLHWCTGLDRSNLNS